MQKIIVEQPYRFVPPHRGTWWPRFIRYFNLQGIWLRRSEGVETYECRNVESLRRSLAAGHGILIAPNHCRNADPVVMGWLSKEAGCLVYAMASWHLYNEGAFKAWAIQKMGGFSVNREGLDKQAIDTAIDVLVDAQRPLVIFPEGAVTRTNDRLHALYDGVAMIARTAAKRREKHGRHVVVHPVGLKYVYSGDILATADTVLSDLEQRISWLPQRHLPLLERVRKLGLGMLALKEIEYLSAPRAGSTFERIEYLMDHLLRPVEEEWLGGGKNGGVVPRVKALRMQIVPGMVKGGLDPVERDRRWHQLARVYLAQQLSCYPPDYLAPPVSVDRLLETLERLEEDLTDKARVHGKLKVIIQVGEPIEVAAHRDRTAAVDPLMARIEQSLKTILESLSKESTFLAGEQE